MQNRYAALAFRQLAYGSIDVLIKVCHNLLRLVILTHYLAYGKHAVLNILIGFQIQHNNGNIVGFQGMQITLVHALVSNYQIRLQLHDFFYVNIKDKAYLGSILGKSRHLAYLCFGTADNLAVDSLHQLQKGRGQDNDSFRNLLQGNNTLVIIGNFYCAARTGVAG